MKTRATLIDFLPELYRPILPEFFEQPLAEERHATCDRCAMCPPEEPSLSALSAGQHFAPDTKCCTYHPVLPNYAVGGLLLDQSSDGAEGRRRIQAKITHRIGVTPMGILPSPKRRLLYAHGTKGFGRAKTLVCPYLDQEHGRCTVWSHREAVCTTWFCKYNQGQDGLSFWQELRNYLIGAQFTLASYALHSLDWDVDQINKSMSPESELDAEGLDETPPDDREYARMWGDWVGREEELYVRTYELIRSLDRQTFERLGGIRHSIELDRLEKRYNSMLKPVLPDPLLRNPTLRVQRAADGSYLLVSYTGSDPARLRKAVYDLLDYFDGRASTATAQAAIFQDRGLWLSEALLTKLYQHRVLIDAAKSQF